MAREQHCPACGEQIRGITTGSPDYVICPCCLEQVPADYEPAYYDRETEPEAEWGNLFDGA